MTDAIELLKMQKQILPKSLIVYFYMILKSLSSIMDTYQIQ